MTVSSGPRQGRGQRTIFQFTTERDVSKRLADIVTVPPRLDPVPQRREGKPSRPSPRPETRTAILGQMVTIHEEGIEWRVTAAEAFFLKVTNQGLQGNGAAVRVAMTDIEGVRQRRLQIDY